MMADTPNAFKWLHLSDLHLEEEAKYDVGVVLRGVVTTLRRRKHERFFPLDAIFFTGDIAHSGKPEEYAAAKLFLTNLLEATGVSPDRIFMIPGNHDADQGRIAPGLQYAIDDQETCDSAFRCPRTLRLLTQKFDAFRDFASPYGQAPSSPDETLLNPWSLDRPILCSTFMHHDHRVGVIGVNTAWLSTKDDDKTKMVISRPLLRKAFDEMGSTNPDIVFFLQHHPFSWLAGFEAKSIENRLRTPSGADLLLTGHEHADKTEQSTSSAGELVWCAAGALYDHETYRKTILFGRWEPTNANIITLPLIYKEVNDIAQWVRDGEQLGDRLFAGPFSLPNSVRHRPLSITHGDRVHAHFKIKLFPGSAARATACVWVETDDEVKKAIVVIEYRCIAGPKETLGRVWKNRAHSENFSQTWAWNGDSTIQPVVCFKDGSYRELEHLKCICAS